MQYDHRGHVNQRALARKATAADVISLSGCKDDQTSADTFEDGAAVGAASHVGFPLLSCAWLVMHDLWAGVHQSNRGAPASVVSRVLA
jgi:hypothetical protein